MCINKEFCINLLYNKFGKGNYALLQTLHYSGKNSKTFEMTKL